MGLMQKISFAVTGGLGVVILILAVLLYFCYNRVIAVESLNAVLTADVERLGTAVEKEVQRGELIAALTAKLEKNDDARQQQLLQFNKQLNTLKQNSAEARAVLATVIPRDALRGLWSFDKSSRPGGSGAGAGASDRAAGKALQR